MESNCAICNDDLLELETFRQFADTLDNVDLKIEFLIHALYNMEDEWEITKDVVCGLAVILNEILIQLRERPK